ncbi:MAG: hypothetical protein QNJ72_04545 [Pleurocapsa sp. MO_226.B13]|nr:hypothetical protein [Pleurocapsa sp. MO_226.B13]
MMTNSSHQDQLNRLNRAISKASGQHFTLITVSCNYEQLREDILSHLLKQCPVEIKILELLPETKNLFNAIKSQLQKWGEEKPSAVMILGLEQVHDLESLLANAKGERDRFREHFHFPLVLWMTDEVRKKLANVATDFYNWTSIPISFKLTNEQLIELIKEETTEETNVELNTILNQGADSFFAQKTLEQEHSRQRRELELAQRELQERGIDLQPELQDSLNLYFVIASDYWTWKRAYLQKYLTIFEQAQREDLIAKFISKLGEVLLRLEKWDDLQEIALKSQKLHESTNSPLQLAQDFGFQAKVALEKGKKIQQREDAQQLFEQALNFATQALQIFKQVGGEQQQSCQVWYLLLLAEAHQQLNQTRLAIDNLEEAKNITNPQDNPQRYIEISNKLRDLYYEQKQYLKAFEIKQERQKVEGQFGFRPFIGTASLQPQNPTSPDGQEKVAAAITVSGRQNYVDKLLSRFYRYDTKLTVVHGPLGVGKSSTIKAGLIPSLKQKIIQDCDVLPFPLSLYDNWVREIGQILTDTHLKSLSNHPERFSESGNSPKILEADLKSLIELMESAKIEIKTLKDQLQQLINSIEDEAAKQELTTYYQRLVNSHPLTQEHLERLKEHPELIINNLESPETEKRKVYSEYLDALIKKEEKIKTLQNRLKQHADSLDSKAAAELRTCLGRIDKPLDSIEEIKAQLHNNKNWNWLTVLIFDQFEDFFFTCPEAKKQKEFWTFLNDCLDTDLVYVVLSLRQDYLLYLLKWEPFIKTGTNWQDILSSRNRLPLKDFDKDAAKKIVQTLTKQSQFYLEEELIDRLVSDLANNSGSIRPIELQLLGYQLQEKGISTLREYENLRNEPDEIGNDSNLTNKDSSKAILVQKYLKEVVGDCGPENKQEADLILYLLTDENYNRPLKTRSEIVRELQSLKEVEEEKLNLVLNIFVKSGLVRPSSQISDDRYQLVHDYLVSLIRSKKRPTEYQELVEKLEVEKRKRIENQKEKEILKARNEEIAKRQEATSILNEKLTQQIREREKIEGTLTEVRRKIRKAVSFGSVLIAGLFAIAGIIGISALNAQKKLDINKMKLDSQQVLDDLNSGILEESFLKAMVLGNKLHKMGMVDKGTKGESHYPAVTPIFALQQTFDAIQKQEKRLLSENNYEVIAVNFTADGQVAGILTNGNIITWNPQTPEKPKTIPVLQNIIQSARIIKFSPDGQQKILVTLVDSTVIVRNTQEQELARFKAHDKPISDASFSPDGNLLATSSYDGVTRIWDFQGNEQAECENPEATDKQVLGVSFSHTGNELATVSADGFVRLWDRQCTLINKFPADDELSESDDAIQSVSFSPDRTRLAVGLHNGTVVLWDIQNIKDAKKIEKILAHDSSVLNIKFSHDGKRLATATSDTTGTTVRLWDKEGNQLDQFKGHDNRIWDIDFNGDGTLLATASADGTVRLWTLEPKSGQTIIETYVFNVIFSKKLKNLIGIV